MREGLRTIPIPHIKNERLCNTIVPLYGIFLGSGGTGMQTLVTTPRPLPDPRLDYCSQPPSNLLTISHPLHFLNSFHTCIIICLLPSFSPPVTAFIVPRPALSLLTELCLHAPWNNLPACGQRHHQPLTNQPGFFKNKKV